VDNQLFYRAKRLTGFKRSAYQGKITLDYWGGSARKAEREMGWGRLEEHWNGELLDSVNKAINWAGTMTINPLIG
jgi:hypothetical protein